MAIKSIDTEILVLGGGLAGTFAAIKAKEAGVRKVTLVSRGNLGKDGVSTFAAGMYAMSATPEDDKDELFKRAAAADDYGAGLFDPDWLEVAMEEEYERAVDMDKYGVEWEKTPDGEFERKFMRSGFGMAAMFHGTQMMEAMAKKVIESGVEVIGYTMITGLLTDNGKPGGGVTGAVGFNIITGEFKVFKDGGSGRTYWRPHEALGAMLSLPRCFRGFLYPRPSNCSHRPSYSSRGLGYGHSSHQRSYSSLK